jgi:hypothetical protein
MADKDRSFRDEQLTFCVRYMVDLEVRERFMTFVKCSECLDADRWNQKIVKENSSHSWPSWSTNCCAGLRGASVMSGKDNGVQKQFRDIHPAAAYVHCMTYKLNLVIVASYMKS